MEPIASFQVDHRTLNPGLYLSRRDGSVITFDLRFKKPNTGDLLTNAQLRNSPQKDAVVYFGPMGCQTGFYFLFDGDRLSLAEAVKLLQEVFAAGAAWQGDMPGQSEAECGNYRNLSVELARAQCGYYAGLIAHWDVEQLAY